MVVKWRVLISLLGGLTLFNKNESYQVEENMNDKNTPKSYSSLSQQLNGIFDHMDEINTSFKKIEAFIEQEYKNIEQSINPEKSRDVSKELEYHTANFLRNLAKDYETKNRLFD